MADEPQEPTAAENTLTEPQAQDASQTETPGPVPYERFKEVNERAKQMESRLAQIEADAKARQEKELVEQQKWQELAQAREQELRQLQSEQMRMRVASSKNLPLDLADRLRGETEDEISEDADRLLSFIQANQPQPQSGPGVPPASRNGQATRLDISKMTPEEIRQNKQALLGT